MTWSPIHFSHRSSEAVLLVGHELSTAGSSQYDSTGVTVSETTSDARIETM